MNIQTTALVSALAIAGSQAPDLNAERIKPLTPESTTISLAGLENPPAATITNWSTIVDTTAVTNLTDFGRGSPAGLRPTTKSSTAIVFRTVQETDRVEVQAVISVLDIFGFDASKLQGMRAVLHPNYEHFAAHKFLAAEQTGLLDQDGLQIVPKVAAVNDRAVLEEFPAHPKEDPSVRNFLLRFCLDLNQVIPANTVVAIQMGVKVSDDFTFVSVRGTSLKSTEPYTAVSESPGKVFKYKDQPEDPNQFDLSMIKITTSAQKLAITKSDNGTVVSWTGSGQLEATDQLSAPNWTKVPVVPGATSYTNSPAEGSKFFRLAR